MSAWNSTAMKDSKLSSKPCLSQLWSHKLSIWPLCCTGWLVKYTMVWSPIQRFQWMSFASYYCSSYLSSSVNVHYYLLWRICSESTSLSLCCHASACRPKMVATVRAFYSELVSYLMFWLAEVSSVIGSMETFITRWPKTVIPIHTQTSDTRGHSQFSFAVGFVLGILQQGLIRGDDDVVQSLIELTDDVTPVRQQRSHIKHNTHVYSAHTFCLLSILFSSFSFFPFLLQGSPSF